MSDENREDLVRRVALAAGLELALKILPHDVIAAAAQAAAEQAALTPVADPWAEPWPPMRPMTDAPIPDAPIPDAPMTDAPATGQ